MNRQEYWKSKGYTDENIQNHLQWERRKAKESRERNMFRVIKGKKLKELLDNHLICIRCGANKGEKGGCSSWGKFWKRHIYK